MSPPSKDSPEKKEDEKLSVEEKGGICSNPALHQEPIERACKAVLFMQAGLGEFVPQLHFTPYLMFGTGPEIKKQFTTIKEFEETKKPPGIPVPFLGISPDNDNFFFSIQLCGKKIRIDVKVDPNMCYLQLEPSLALVSIDGIEVKSRNCLHGPWPQDMRLYDPKLPASIHFSVLCDTRTQVLTKTNITMIMTAIDGDGKENHSHMVEKHFPVFFYDKHADTQKNPNAGNPLLMSSNDKKILEDNHSKLCSEIQNWLSFIEWFVINGVLDKGFLKFLNEDGSFTDERKGEILRHLYEAENILPKFIEALKASLNKELMEFLLQCMASMGDQNSSLE